MRQFQTGFNRQGKDDWFCKINEKLDHWWKIFKRLRAIQTLRYFSLNRTNTNINYLISLLVLMLMFLMSQKPVFNFLSCFSSINFLSSLKVRAKFFGKLSEKCEFHCESENITTCVSHLSFWKSFSKNRKVVMETGKNFQPRVDQTLKIWMGRNLITFLVPLR